VLEVELNEPADLEVPASQETRRLGRRRRVMSSDQKKALELKIGQWIDRWKSGASDLHNRLRKYNDHMEGVTEPVSFPWPGASTVTMGIAPGMARTLRATFSRAVFSDHTPYVATSKDGKQAEDRNKLESAVNWLSEHDSNLNETLKDTPVVIFRDGTAMVWGEWERRIEKVVDVKMYETIEEFKKSYPSSEDAGVGEDLYNEIEEHLLSLDGKVHVEFLKDEVTRNAPDFYLVPLARFVSYPLSAERLSPDCFMYGRQFFEDEQEVRHKAKRKLYDKEPVDVAIAGVSGYGSDDQWSLSRERVEGISRDGDQVKLLENYKIVIRYDIDEDGIPEKYLATYNLNSRKFLEIERYRLRKNIDCVVPFRFIRRDGRLLGVSFVEDGYSQFRMVDDLNRHRQNVRAITDSPAFLCPESAKDYVDFGSEASIFRPGITFWLPDNLMKEDMSPRQLQITSLSRTNESLDEERGVIRYLEFRLGPGMALSGQESPADPKAPAAKHLSQIRLANARLEDLVGEWRRSVHLVLELQSALYAQNGPEEITYGKIENESRKVTYEEASRDLFALENTGWDLKVEDISLSPEIEMEKIMGVAAIGGQNPLVLQSKPQVLLELWNRLVFASRLADPQKLTIPMNDPKAKGMIDGILEQGNQPPTGAGGEPDLGAPTPNQEAMLAFSNGAPRGDR